MRSYGYEVLRFYGYEVLRFCGCEVLRLWGKYIDANWLTQNLQTVQHCKLYNLITKQLYLTTAKP